MILTSGSITSWQIEGGKVEIATDFIFLGSKITAVTAATKLKDACSLEEKCDKHRQLIKKQSYHLADKVLYSQSYGFSSIMYGCESWSINKAESRRTDAFELWC